MSRILGQSEKKSGKPASEPVVVPAAPASTESVHDYCHLLIHDQSQPVDEVAWQLAWKQLEEFMALVPEGEITLAATDPDSLAASDSDLGDEVVWVDSLYLDRYCVTQSEYAEFVEAGGYSQDHLWPPEVLAKVLQFVDQTGCPGPRFWANGRPNPSDGRKPVVGICWYEANAYAHWRGKRLPTPAEWQRAATWAAGQACRSLASRYPWGDAFDPSRCNTWNSGLGETVPVDEYYKGSTPNGIFQLIGNVWEWTAALFECDASADGDRVLTDQALGEIRGGAFDTYFSSQATGMFRTGQPLLYRGANVGFRCAITASQVVSSPDPYAFLEGESES